MSKALYVAVFVGVLVLGLFVGVAFGQALPPCNESGGPGNSDYARHHITPLAHGGDLGAVDHDGDGVFHVPGSHRGYSLCDPSGP